MQWYRSNIRNCSRIALCALVVQFALAFGHSHAGRFEARLLPVAQASVTLADAATNKGGLALKSQVQQEQSPLGGNGDEQTDDFCAICAATAMASTVAVATPAPLLAPQAIRLLHSVTDAEFVHLKSPSIAFQPRAPPAS